MPERTAWSIVGRSTPLSNQEWLDLADCIATVLKPHLHMLAQQSIGDYCHDSWYKTVREDRPQVRGLSLRTRGIFISCCDGKAKGKAKIVEGEYGAGEEYYLHLHLWGVDRNGQWILARIRVLHNTADSTYRVTSVTSKHSSPNEIRETTGLVARALAEGLLGFLERHKSRRESLLNDASRLHAHIAMYLEAAKRCGTP